MIIESDAHRRLEQLFLLDNFYDMDGAFILIHRMTSYDAYRLRTVSTMTGAIVLEIAIVFFGGVVVIVWIWFEIGEDDARA